ncbi:MAG: fibro-slime domain-containing protein [Clostridiales Family XIII bacterium]|jgi:fibro-slime domain-containing protein|nr:fibro-slime domain-containing protein [Clostridiales Family XIII bacterium]
MLKFEAGGNEMLDFGFKKSTRRIIAVVTVFLMLTMLPMSFTGTRAVDESETGADVAWLHDTYAGIPNGTIMPDGSALLYYSVWDLDAFFMSAVKYNLIFDPASVDAEFLSEGVKAEIRNKFAYGWYLLDTFDSKAPTEDGEHSTAYIVADANGSVSIITATREGERFGIHIDPTNSGNDISASVTEYKTVHEAVTEVTEEVPSDAISEDGDIESGDTTLPGNESASTEPAESNEENTLPDTALPDTALPDTDNNTAGTGDESKTTEPDESANNTDNNSGTDSESADEGDTASETSDSISALPNGVSTFASVITRKAVVAMDDTATESGTTGDDAGATGLSEGTDDSQTEAAPADMTEIGNEDLTETGDTPEITDEASTEPVDNAETGDKDSQTEPSDSKTEDAVPEPAKTPEKDNAEAVSDVPEENAVTDETKELEESAPTVLEETVVEENYKAPTTFNIWAGGDENMLTIIDLRGATTVAELEGYVLPAFKEAFNVAPTQEESETSEETAIEQDKMSETVTAPEQSEMSKAEIVPSQGSFSDTTPAEIKKGESISDLISAAVSSLRPAAAFAQAPTGTPAGTPINAGITHFPVNFYDYESMWLSVATYNSDTFNSPGTDPYAQTDEYFLFNKGPSGNGTGVGEQNIPNHGGVEGVGIGGVWPGIAKDNLTDGGELQLNYKTWRNLNLFPEIANENATEVFIYGDTGSSDPNNGIQQTTRMNNQPGMITAYPQYRFPFLKDADGYYYFNSSSHHVHIYQNMLNSKTIPLYLGRQNTYGFFPFNNNDNNTSNLNYNFGMSMAIDFMLPPGGKIGDTAMKYEFTGDDDLWVYIDGKLALDVGGIHNEQTGTIDFSTGLITISNVVRYNAGATYNGNTINHSRATEYWYLYDDEGSDLTGLTVGGQSVSKIIGVERNSILHTMKLFYMDRNPNYSNCSMKFNLPAVEVEKDKLNVFKFADEYIKDEEFTFNVYTATVDGDNPPAPSSYGDNQLQPVNLKKDGNFTVDIDLGEGTWIRVVEEPVITAGGQEKYSTVFLSSGSDGGKTSYGKDTGWIKYNGTSGLFFINYTQHPVELTKYKLDDVRWNATKEVFEYQTMDGVKFDLYEVGNIGDDTGTLIKSDLVTDAGKIVLNDPYMAGSPKLEQGKIYMLKEKNQENYVQAPIYFTTTDGVSPKVKELTNNGADAGQIVFADTSGRHIEFYNKRLTGSVTVNKTLTNIEDVNFAAQGNPIFLFKLEKSKEASFDDIIGTQTAHAEFTDTSSGPEPAKFNDLEAGYYYRISELNTMRYDREDAASLTGTDNIDDNNPNTVIFLMTGELAKEISGPNPGKTVAANFTNSRNYADYLSDTAVNVNSFSVKSNLPTSTTPLMYAVRIERQAANQWGSNTYLETRYVTQNDLVSLSGISLPAPDNSGAIGTISYNGISTSAFTLTTPINGACTIVLNR